MPTRQKMILGFGIAWVLCLVVMGVMASLGTYYPGIASEYVGLYKLSMLGVVVFFFGMIAAGSATDT